MKPLDQSVAIHKALGYKLKADATGWKTWYHKAMGWTGDVMHDYLNDLNAIHEAEKILTDDQWSLYESYMWDSKKTIEQNGRALVSASAGQRCEAFLRTLGLWIESS